MTSSDLSATGATAPRRVLVVEDDAAIHEALVDRLQAEGFAVTSAYDGPAAVDAFTAADADGETPEIVLLDVMLPGFDGHEVCRRIQAIRPVPVLMLTARDDEIDVLIGLGVGADDYLTKPFRMREVVARIQALLRRVDRAAELARGTHGPEGPGAPPAVRDGDLTVDTAARTVVRDGEAVHLTRTEFDLLVALLSRPGRVLRRETLLVEVWDWDPAALDATSTRTVDSHVRSLRAKVGADRIRTATGVGYAWVAADTRTP